MFSSGRVFIAPSKISCGAARGAAAEAPAGAEVVQVDEFHWSPAYLRRAE
jgi:hypothetical protein